MTGAWMKKSQLDCVKILTPSRCTVAFEPPYEQPFPVGAPLPCRWRKSTSEWHTIGIDNDQMNQWESARISGSKRTIYLKEAQTKQNTTNQLFCHMRNHAQNFFAPKPRRSWGKLIWSVAADLTLDTAGAPGVPFLVTFPISKLHRNNNSGDHCDCGSFFSTFLFGRAWRCENGETSQFFWWSCWFGGWRDIEIERELMGVS